MEAILLQHNTAMPGRHILEALADKFRYFTCCCSIPLFESAFVSLSSKMWLLLLSVSVNHLSGRGKLLCNSSKYWVFPSRFLSFFRQSFLELLFKLMGMLF